MHFETNKKTEGPSHIYKKANIYKLNGRKLHEFHTVKALLDSRDVPTKKDCNEFI